MGAVKIHLILKKPSKHFCVQKDCSNLVVVLIISMNFKEPYSQYSLLLDRTARKVKSYAQQRFKELDLDITVDQWLVLKHTSENAGISQKELAAILYKDMPTVTRIVDLLCSKGLVKRVVHPNDRRSFVLELTDEGETKVARSREQIRAIRLKAWDGLNEHDFEAFNKILSRIYDNLNTEPIPAGLQH